MIADELLAYVTEDEPPMHLTAQRLVTLGRRRRRLRLLGSIGGGGVAVAVALAVFFAQLPGTTHRPQVLTPMAGCLAGVPIDSSAPGDLTGNPLVRPSLDIPLPSPVASPPPATEDQLSQVGCTAAREVPALLPGRRFYPHDNRAWPAFQAVFRNADVWSISTQGRLVGGGEVTIMVSPQFDSPPTQEQLKTDLPWKDMPGIRLEDDGTGVVVMTYTDRMPMGDGKTMTDNMAEVWTGHTFIMVGAGNMLSVSPLDFGGTPPLTVEQVRQLALNPGFAVFG